MTRTTTNLIGILLILVVGTLLYILLCNCCAKADTNTTALEVLIINEKVTP